MIEIPAGKREHRATFSIGSVITGWRFGAEASLADVELVPTPPAETRSR